ncbi:MAG: alpha/beta hydrolase [Pseudomonadota bacterium]
MIILLAAAGVIVVALVVAELHLSGENLARFDTDTGQRFASERAPSPEIAAAMALMTPKTPAKGLSHARRIVLLREEFDNMFADRVHAARFIAVAADGVRGEWVLAPGADPRRRMLFVHGGGFQLGSARSHRTITARFAELTGGAVLALDYRLMPEHKRMAGVDDCRQAYRWLLANGPDGAAPAQALFVAGDSAGANLSLALLAWVRDQGLRAADAAVVLSPPTDTTFASPSIRTNLASDLMLGPHYGILGWMPRSVLMWLSWLRTGIRPNDPLVSPVYGDLSQLPPLLVHVSETEMLFDDARRYVNRARAAGSPATLQSWNHTLHAWHILYPELPEAREAFDEIGKFLAAAAPPERIAA